VNSIRRRLIVLVLAVMACQLIGFAAAPIAVCQMGSPATSTVSVEVTCECPRDSTAECPMHPHQKPAPSRRETRWCAGCQDSQELVLMTLIGVAGAIVQCRHPGAPEGVSESLAALFERPLDVVRPPFSPPPRG
jgi:hypothetical protein